MFKKEKDFVEKDIKIKVLQKNIGVPFEIANLLIQRGIEDFDAAKNFFRPELSDLHDPYLMLGMDKAVNRISTAIANHEKIMVYGDYDVDGTTSVALVFSYLTAYYPEISLSGARVKWWAKHLVIRDVRCALDDP